MPALTVGNADIVLTASAANIIAAGAGEQWLILKATACNDSAAAQTINIYRVGSGGTASAANQIDKTLPITAGGTVVLPISGQTLVDGQALQGLASLTDGSTGCF